VQVRIFWAMAIFLGSYLPLSIILLAQDYDYKQPFCWRFWDGSCAVPLAHPWFAISIFVACTVCFLLTLIALSVVKPKHHITIGQAKPIPAELMNYTLPYVVSFMSIDYQETGKFVGFVIFLAWMFWITHRSGQILLNPVLIAFGWRYYDVSYRFAGDKEDRNSNALVRGVIEAGEQHRQIAVQDILIIKPEPTEGA
jgi:hypothetical protein